MQAGLQLGNSKLGQLIHAWSVPAIHTCPGSSGLCRNLCYAARGHFHQTNVKNSHQRNYQFAKTPAFARWMIGELVRESVKILRIHVAGDFFDSTYLANWYEIVQRSPQVQFFVYTRSWRVPELLPRLQELSRLPNMSLWFSQDRETGPAPVLFGVRRAYLAINDTDAATAPADCDLVFREKTKTVMKHANGVLVCPAENGVTHNSGFKHTCSKCQLCFQRANPVGLDLMQAILQPTIQLVAPHPKKGLSRARTHAKERRRHQHR